MLERTFEIGLRKAVGARAGDILKQFLLEAILITGLGGVIGVIIGVGISFGVSSVAQALGYNWQFTVPLYSIILAVGFSVICGVVFGLYPARRAAALEPVEALRQE